MDSNDIKFSFKMVLFLIGLFLFVGGGYAVFLSVEGVGQNKLQDITIGQSFLSLLFLVGVYITTNLLKSRTITRLEMKREKEFQKKNRNNGN
jgi:hypothetical protein